MRMSFLFALVVSCSLHATAGTLLAVDTVDGTVEAFDTLAPGSSPTTFASGIFGAFGITTDSSGNVYVGETGNYDVLKYSRSGTFLGVFATTFMEGATALAIDSSGNLFVGVYTQILKYSPTGVFLSAIFTGNFTSNDGLAFDSAGNLYDADPNNVIRRYSPTGAYLGSWTGSVVQPGAIVFDASGNLLVNNYYTIGVSKFTSAGTDLGSLGLMPTPMYGYGMGFDSAGNLFVSTGTLPPPPGQVQGYGVLEFSPSGTYLGSFGNKASGYLALLPDLTPEPATWTICGLGLVALISARRTAFGHLRDK